MKIEVIEKGRMSESEMELLHGGVAGSCGGNALLSCNSDLFSVVANCHVLVSCSPMTWLCAVHYTQCRTTTYSIKV